METKLKGMTLGSEELKSISVLVNKAENCPADQAQTDADCSKPPECIIEFNGSTYDGLCRAWKGYCACIEK